MAAYHRGRRAEWRARKTLEREGYTVTRSAGSKGAWDLLGYRPDGWIVVQIKTGAAPPSKPTLRVLLTAAARLPPHTTAWVWVYPPGQSVKRVCLRSAY